MKQLLREEPKSISKNGDKARGFLDFLNSYNFTVHEDGPNDQTVAVDPEMLGHIFENLLEDNKDKGAYYTPKPIVHYMCQESLIEYLVTYLTQGQTRSIEALELRPKVERFVKEHELEDVVDYDSTLAQALRDVKICDPAIGSGAFPMGLLQEIYIAVEALCNFGQGPREIWKQDADFDKWNGAKVKLDIIQNSIYGVDIEKGAVDIARLRFWLSLIVDEDSPKPLPNLDYKIVQGNSLVSSFENQSIIIDWNVKGGTEIEQKIKALAQKLFDTQKSFFNSKGDKEILKSKINKIKIDLLLAQLDVDKTKYSDNSKTTGDLFVGLPALNNLDIQMRLAAYDSAIAKLKSLAESDQTLEFFDWTLNFPEILNAKIQTSVGFDIIVANPPYLGTKEIGAVAQDLYHSVFGFKDDMYNYFFRLSLQKLKKNGTLCFITPNTYMTLSSKESLRLALLSKHLSSVMHVGYVFDAAFVDTVITLVRNTNTNENYKITYKSAEKKFSSPEIYVTDSETYLNTNNYAIFKPNVLNLKLHRTIQPTILRQKEKYWKYINSHSIPSTIQNEIGVMVKKPEEGYFLLGLLATGAQGLVTGNNSKYLACITDNSNDEDAIFEDFKNKLILQGGSLIIEKGKYEERSEYYEQAEKLKIVKKKPALFGKFYLYKTVTRERVKSFTDLTPDEQQYGCHEDVWIAYARGNEEGLKWSVPYKEAILWSKKSVKELREGKITNSRFQGSMFYGTSGFGWVDYFTNELKGFYIEPGPYSKNVVKFHAFGNIPDHYLIGILNSSFGTYYIKNFITNTHTLQVNDGKQFPIKLSHSFVSPICQTVSLITSKPNINEHRTELLQLNVLVFKLYELTYYEVKIVDPTFAMSEAEYNAYEPETVEA